MGLLEAAAAQPVGAGEGALLVAEQLALGERLGQRRAVDRHERPARPRPPVVQAVRDELLAGAGLAGHEHRHVARRHPVHEVEELDEPRIAGDELGAALLGREQAGDDGEQRGRRRQRLGQVVGGAEPHRLDRLGDRAVGGEHDQRRRRGELADGAQQADAVEPRHALVREHEVERPPLEGGERLGTVAHLDDVVAGPLEDVREQLAERRLVVGDEDARHVTSSPPGR